MGSIKMPSVSRRHFLMGGLGLAFLAGLAKFGHNFLKPSPVSGRILGASSSLGHKLRAGGFAEPTQQRQTKVVIVGGGIAGLSAAWKLQKSGVQDFVVLELENEAGGNAHSGENAVSAYPWGAHYVPLLTDESRVARELFEEINIITGYQDGLPIYDEYFLSADPHERLFMQGRWHEGIVPQIGISAEDQAQYKSFFAAMDGFKNLKGSDGKKVFAIPVDMSSSDPKWRALDEISIADYMRQHGWNSVPLKWYVDYCCRDDYGATAENVSAWAGIHYFAGRTGRAANADLQSVVTWPEGNGWIVKQLRAKLGDHIETNKLAFNVSRTKDVATVRYFDAATNEVVEVTADAVIMATPRFIAERLSSTGLDMQGYHYSPWMVANVTLDAMPLGKGAPLAWDNMIYDSTMLGYVVATHQNLNRVQHDTVLTYYWPLSHKTPAEARTEMLARTYEEWRDTILKELLQIHPDLNNHVKHLDVWLWGHGMICPVPGFLWGKMRQKALVETAPLFHAHSDMSGISIFEEANYRGVKAAEAAMTHIGHAYRSSL